MSRAYIVDVPPCWSIEDLLGIVKGIFPAGHILDRLRWSVGDMRTATWRITAEGAIELFGRVFHTDGLTPLLVISEAECNACKDKAMAPRPQIASNAPRKAFITASKTSQAMDLDTEVRAKLKVLKRAQSPLNNAPLPNGEPS